MKIYDAKIEQTIKPTPLSRFKLTPCSAQSEPPVAHQIDYPPLKELKSI